MWSREIFKNPGFPNFLSFTLILSFVYHLYHYVLNIKTDLFLRFIFIHFKKKFYITTADRKCTLFPVSMCEMYAYNMRSMRSMSICMYAYNNNKSVLLRILSWPAVLSPDFSEIKSHMTACGLLRNLESALWGRLFSVPSLP